VVVVDVLQGDSSRILGVMNVPPAGHGDPDHIHGLLDRVRHVLRPHSHDAADKVDAATEASAAGIRARAPTPRLIPSASQRLTVLLSTWGATW
jgi:hypothetical protein